MAPLSLQGCLRASAAWVGALMSLSRQNGYAERFVGTLRRELLDHLIVLGERHLLRAVRDLVAYYNGDRPHMALGGDAPVNRRVEPPTRGKVVALARSEGFTTATRGPRDRPTSSSPSQSPA
jgi:hypothetical protein